MLPSNPPNVPVNPTVTTTVTTAPAPAPSNPILDSLISDLPTSVVKFLANIVSVGHKEAAFVMGVLAAFNVVPTTNATTDHIGAILLLGYSAVTHAANALGPNKVA